MSEENKAIVRRFFEELWADNPDAIDDLMDAACDGDICYPRPGGSLPSTEEAFSAANRLICRQCSYTVRGDDQDSS